MPLLEELSDSLKADPVIRELHSKDVLLRMVKEITPAITSDKPKFLIEAADTLRAISTLLGDYYETTKNIIRTNVSNKKEKKLISIVAEIFIIDIQLRGYSREYIRYSSKIKLASRLLRSNHFDVIEALEDFFSSFDRDIRTYSCIVKCNGEIEAIAAKAFKMTIVDKPEEFKKIDLLDIRANEQNVGSETSLERYLLVSELKAKDPFQARERLYNALNAQNALRQFLQHRSTLSFARICLVKDDETQGEIRVRDPINVMLRGQTQKSLTSGFVEKQADFISAYRKLDEKSKSSIFSAVRYHKEAMDSLAVENQLVDLWAALEGFVPQPLDASPRIGSVLDHILPAQTLIYLEKKFSYIAEGIQRVGDATIAIVESIDIPGSFVRKTAAIILCPEFEKSLNQLMPLLGGSPLLRFRMFQLYEALSTRQKVGDELQRHRQRLDRQLCRIYISRNTVMHSATVHSDIDILVENLHSYLDILVNATICIAKQSAGRTNINAVLKILSTYEKSYLDMLLKSQKKDDPFSKTDFGDVFFEYANPLLKSITLT
ncbi:hypothetical protein [Collimonas sp. PA-H2]|uniref:hypothetical protein n=1 Tax=Collimonas sp. PA-H2 TaxID=1881062 RepID=UPI00117C93A8|nr:hypothetical protein [Collimonas sp. PA-H2]